MENQQVLTTDWEAFINEIALSILSEQTPQRFVFICGDDIADSCRFVVNCMNYFRIVFPRI